MMNNMSENPQPVVNNEVPLNREYFDNKYADFRDVCFDNWETVISDDEVKIEGQLHHLLEDLPKGIAKYMLTDHSFVAIVFQEFNDIINNRIQTIREISHSRGKSLSREEAIDEIIQNPSSAMIEQAIKTAYRFWQEQTKAGLDPLTRVNNRFKLQEIGGHLDDNQLERAFTNISKELTVVFFDADDFKMINDNHGHCKGDEVLVIIGKVLNEILRDYDIAVRYGGEEFVLFAPDLPKERAEKIRNLIGEKIQKEIGLKVTISAGMANIDKKYLTSGANLWVAINAADTALYLSKEQEGKNLLTKISLTDANAVQKKLKKEKAKIANGEV
jgi:diguanylate cyclase (GGDEF)-like protein